MQGLKALKATKDMISGSKFLKIGGFWGLMTIA